jgi:predicted HTH domain antitoxin
MSSAAHLEIPLDVLDSARLTLEELRTELAIYLYEQGRLSFGKAHELAGLSVWEFRQLLGSSRISPHFGVEGLQQDLETLRELEWR